MEAAFLGTTRSSDMKEWDGQIWEAMRLGMVDPARSAAHVGATPGKALRLLLLRMD